MSLNCINKTLKNWFLVHLSLLQGKLPSLHFRILSKVTDKHWRLWNSQLPILGREKVSFGILRAFCRLDRPSSACIGCGMIYLESLQQQIRFVNYAGVVKCIFFFIIIGMFLSLFWNSLVSLSSICHQFLITLPHLLHLSFIFVCAEFLFQNS